MSNTTHWETMQSIPNYFRYLQTHFDSWSEPFCATQENIQRSRWGIHLQREKYQPWLTPQSRQLWQPQCRVNQYTSWDTYCRMIKRNSLLSVIDADDARWAYLLCFSSNLPTSVLSLLSSGVGEAERYRPVWSSFHLLKSYQLYYSARSIRA